MELQFYIDENYPGPVVNGLRQAGIDVLTYKKMVGPAKWTKTF